MNWRNSIHGYGLLQIMLHWIMALIVAVMVPLGLWMTGLDYYDPWYKQGPDLHRAIGVVFGMLLLVRWLWRHTQPRPRVLTASPREARAARITHALLYLLPLLIVISGYLISTADGRSIDVFGWFEVPATIQGIDRQEDIAGDVHFALAMLLLGVIVLHVAAALRHHFVFKDATLRRMLSPNNHT